MKAKMEEADVNASEWSSVTIRRLPRRIQDLRAVKAVLSQQSRLLEGDYDEALLLLEASDVRLRATSRHEERPRLLRITNKWNDIGRLYAETRLHGLVQAELEAAGRRLIRRQPQRPVVFLSYRRNDSPRTSESIYWVLRKAFGDGAVFMDKHDIRPGAPFPKDLEDKLRASKIVLALIGPDWGITRRTPLKNWLVKELTLAIARMQAGHLTILPVLMESATMPKEKTLPAALVSLSTLQALTISRDVRFDDNVSKLLDAIVDDLASARRLTQRGDPEGFESRVSRRSSTHSSSALKGKARKS